MIAFILLACQAKDDGSTSDSGTTPTVVPPPTTDTPPPTTVTDTDTPPTDDTADPTLPTGLHGTVPPVALAAPSFSGVTNRDGSARSQADLLGHPTVMWFYPAAFTGG